MRVTEILAAKGSNVISVSPEQTVIGCIGELSRRGIGAVVVSRDGRSIDGIASERDIVRAINQYGSRVLDLPIKELMSSPVITCTPSDDLQSLMTTMTKDRIRHLPVVDGNGLAGLVSIGDVVKMRVQELENDRAALEHYITAR